MKAIYLIISFIFPTIANGQQLFSISLEQDKTDNFNDVIEINDKFYFLQIRYFNLIPPFKFDSYCEIVESDENGTIIGIYPLSDKLNSYQRIVSFDENNIYLIGQVEVDSCQWKFVISRFNITTHNVDHLSFKDYCNQTIQKIKIVNGLNNKTLIEEYHQSGNGLAKHIHEIDSSYNLILKLDSITWPSGICIDFSRKGYLVTVDRLKKFYDAEFNFIKQKFFHEDVSSQNETHRPFGKSYILIQTINDQPGEREEMRIMVVDSALRVIKENIMHLPEDSPVGFHNPAYFGGLEMRNENEIWVLGGGITNTSIGYYYFARLDSNLNIVCQHFLGYDTWYRMYGFRILDSGGVIVFGARLRDGFPLPEGDAEGIDVFAFRAGANCELPKSVSVDGAENPLQSISAYPNPGINNISFTVNGFDPGALDVQFIDVTGQILFTDPDLSDPVSVPNLAPGQYFYRIMQGERLLGTGSWLKQ